MRLEDKVAIVSGGGQSPGDTIGNGRASALLFAREGAKVFLVDSRVSSAEETQQMIETEGGIAFPFSADITVESDCEALAAKCAEVFGRIEARPQSGHTESVIRQRPPFRSQTVDFTSHNSIMEPLWCSLRADSAVSVAG